MEAAKMKIRLTVEVEDEHGTHASTYEEIPFDRLTTATEITKSLELTAGRCIRLLHALGWD